PSSRRSSRWRAAIVPAAAELPAMPSYGYSLMCELYDPNELFDAYPEASFCLDVAHVWTNDPSLRLGHRLIDRFGHRLRQLHVSGIEPDGTHRPTTRADLDLYAPLLARCRHVPWLLEAELAD